MGEERIRTVRSADGTEIGWVETGSGPPLVLVHGSTADHTRWATVLEPLAARFTVHAMDRRGRGLSGDAEPYDVEREFDDVVAVVEAIGEPVALLGHSYGAFCALNAATRTASIGKLILYEPPLPVGIEIVSETTLQRVDELLARDDREGALVTFMTEVVRMPPDNLERMRSLPAWQARIAAAHTLTRESRVEGYWTVDTERLEQLTTPTLLLLGGDSPPFFVEAIRLLEKILPDARVAILPGQQHVAMDTAPALFVDAVNVFLGEP